MKVKEAIRNYISSQLLFNKIKIDFSDQLIETGALDSVGIMKLVGFLEKEFEIEIDEMEILLSNFASVETISSLVEMKLKSSN